MRCKACDVNLNDNESTRSDEHGDYYDLCHECFYSIYEEDDELDFVEMGLTVRTEETVEI